MGESDAPAFPHRIGRIVRAHGLRGDLLVQLFRARIIEPERMKFVRCPSPKTVELVYPDDRSEIHEVRSVRWVNPANFVVQLSGVGEDREDAERRVGAFLDIEPTAAPEEIVDEVDRVFGARVIDVESGALLGAVEDIRDNGAQAVLVVGDDEILIPWVDEFIDSVIEGPSPEVRVRPIPGLLEANQPTPTPEPS